MMILCTRKKKTAAVLFGCAMAFSSAWPTRGAESVSVPIRWSFEDKLGDGVADASGTYTGKAEGSIQHAPGAEGKSLVFDGASSIVTVPAAPAFSIGDGPFTVSAWINLYELGCGQQMVIAKNDYAAGQREWGLMLDKDDRFRFYTWQGGWKTVGGSSEPKAGQWRHVAAVFNKGEGCLYVNGRLEGRGPLGDAVAATTAPLTIGGAHSGGAPMQLMHGALDEIAIYRTALSADALARLADKRLVPHQVPALSNAVVLWSGGDLPKSADIPVLPGVRFSVIQPHQPDVDGGNWLLGTALVWHKGRLYSSFGFNSGHENTATEEARGRISDDNGKSWGPLFTIDPGEGNLGVSHGVFLSRKDVLWSFNGAFYDKFQRTHTRAYTLDEASGLWQPQGVVVHDGFWPMQEPLKMSDGNWIMAGARIATGYDDMKGHLPAVAISHGDDFRKWDLVVIPSSASGIWGESTVIIDGQRITNISRWGAQAKALMAVSEDGGRTWTPSLPSNLPMTTSKPYAGTLSTGQNYLICTTTADCGSRRTPLTIALSRPRESTFSRVFVIRHAEFPAGPGPSAPALDLSYPYAIEHEGFLYVGYAIKRHMTAEMAVIPLSSLAAP